MSTVDVLWFLMSCNVLSVDLFLSRSSLRASSRLEANAQCVALRHKMVALTCLPVRQALHCYSFSFPNVGTEFPSRSNLREEGLIFILCFWGRPFHHDGKSGVWAPLARQKTECQSQKPKQILPSKAWSQEPMLLTRLQSQVITP